MARRIWLCTFFIFEYRGLGSYRVVFLKVWNICFGLKTNLMESIMTLMIVFDVQHRLGPDSGLASTEIAISYPELSKFSFLFFPLRLQTLPSRVSFYLWRAVEFDIKANFYRTLVFHSGLAYRRLYRRFGQIWPKSVFLAGHLLFNAALHFQWNK